MFKQLGKMFKKLFSRKTDPNVKKIGEKTITVMKDIPPDRVGIGGGNGLITYTQENEQGLQQVGNL